MARSHEGFSVVRRCWLLVKRDRQAIPRNRRLFELWVAVKDAAGADFTIARTIRRAPLCNALRGSDIQRLPIRSPSQYSIGLAPLASLYYDLPWHLAQLEQRPTVICSAFGPRIQICDSRDTWTCGVTATRSIFTQVQAFAYCGCRTELRESVSAALNNRESRDSLSA